MLLLSIPHRSLWQELGRDLEAIVALDSLTRQLLFAISRKGGMQRADVSQKRHIDAGRDDEPEEELGKVKNNTVGKKKKV